MSLVGTRPPTVDEWEKYELHHRSRMSTKPGMPAIGIEQMPEPIQKCQTEKIKIIMAGRLIYWKAFDIGIKAFLQIAEQYPEIELHILGEGNQKKKLQKLAGKYLDNRVFFEKAVQHDEIYQFYGQFDLFVNTTLRDSGCMAMMEAMSVTVLGKVCTSIYNICSYL